MKFANKHWPKSQNDTTFIWIAMVNWRECVWPVVLGPKAIFASCIPEIIDLIGTRPKYGGTLKNERGRRWETTCHYAHFNYPQFIGAQLWLDQNPLYKYIILDYKLPTKTTHPHTNRCPRGTDRQEEILPFATKVNISSCEKKSYFQTWFLTAYNFCIYIWTVWLPYKLHNWTM